MKNIKHLFILMLLLVSSFAFSQDLINPDMWRVNDFTNNITDASLDFVNSQYSKIIEIRRCDFPVCFVSTSDIPIDQYGKLFFEQNKFGFGSNREGIVLVIYTDTKEVSIRGFGGRLDDADYSEVAEKVKTHLKKRYDHYSIAYIYLANIMTFHKTLVPNPKEPYAGTTTTTIVRTESSSTSVADKPDWYPKNISEFKDFHDYNAPRVVDNANIFSAKDKAIMLSEIKKIQDDEKVDLVIFTDTDSYGLSHAVYSADFHHFNGYGFGDDFTGSVLFICMNPNHRGWWTSATGSIQWLYQDMNIINDLDDQLEPYMRAGNYGEGVIDYIRNVYDLYKLPSWYPKDPDNYVKTHKNNPKVVDNAHLFSAEEAEELEQLLAVASNDCSADIIVVTGDERIYGSSWKYADAYFKYQGYGVGDDFDGSILYLYKNDTRRMYSVAIEGSRYASNYYASQVLPHVSDNFWDYEYLSAAKKYIKAVTELYRTGKIRKPRKMSAIYFWTLVAGLVVGFTSAGIKRAGMKSVAQATEAKDYLVDGSFELRNSEDIFLHKTVSKSKIQSSSSSGGGSSGGSYHSSGGRSYSGGGRSF